MKQLTDEQIEEMARQEQLLLVCDDLEALTEIVRATERALAALDTAQPEPVNAMLVEALEANHKWHQDYDDHGGYPESDLCEQNEAAITAAKQAQPEPLITVESSLRFRLESEQQKSADLLEEVRELKGKLQQAQNGGQ